MVDFESLDGKYVDARELASHFAAIGNEHVIDWVFSHASYGHEAPYNELLDVLVSLMEHRPQFSSGGATFTISYDEYNALKSVCRDDRRDV